VVCGGQHDTIGSAPGLRFLLLNQFYPPDDAPTGRMLADLAQALVRRGHEVEAIASRRAYGPAGDPGPGGVIDGISVVRTGGGRFPRRSLFGRLAGYFLYLLGLLWVSGRRPRPDAILTLTTPPFLALAGRLLARRLRSRHAHWAMDLYPDALRAQWPASGTGLAWSMLTWLGRHQFRGAAVVMTPGRSVEAHLRGYVPSGVPIVSVPLWATVAPGQVDGHEVDPERERHGWRPNDLVLMYSGNMGLGHTFSEFLEAARRLDAADIVWAFIGEGVRKTQVEEAASASRSGTTRIEILPFVESARLRVSLASADVHLVSVAPGWEGVMVPSKLQNGFAVARPVLFVGAEATDVAAWIRESGGGWVIPPGNVDALIAAISEARDPVRRRQRGAAALEYARAHFDRNDNCARLADILEGYGA
jgi:colanic acid biosynthesis glycosyl transferase WcaI